MFQENIGVVAVFREDADVDEPPCVRVENEVEQQQPQQPQQGLHLLHLLHLLRQYRRPKKERNNRTH